MRQKKREDSDLDLLYFYFQEIARFKILNRKEERELWEIIKNSSSYNPEQVAELNEELDDMFQKMEKLSKQEQKVLEINFGLNEKKIKTLQRIGNELNLTSSRIYQIKARALQKLKTVLH